MKKALLWVVTYNQTEDTLSAVFTNKDDAVNEYEIRCSEEITEHATLEKVHLQGKTTRQLAVSCVEYGAGFGRDFVPISNPSLCVLIETVAVHSRQTEDAIATEVECV